VSSIFERVNPDDLLQSDGSGGFSNPVDDGFVNWDEKKGQYSSTDNFLNYNPETGTYESEENKKEEEKYSVPQLSDEPYDFPSVRGAAVSVQQSLSNITFVPGTFGGMSGSIAYIRYWSKNGSGQKTAVGSFAQNGTPEDSQQALAGDFAAVQSVKSVGNVNTDVGGFFQPAGETPTAGFVFTQSAPPSRTTLTTPTNTAYQSRPRQPVPTQTTAPRPTGPNIFQRLGSIFSANPGGSAAPAWQNPFFTPPAAPSPDGAVWQFLFNPEELQLSSGPDFNRAETWGVSDPANSGQPLSWRSNKNRKLTFGKVLLHGYSFGKRVDALENGLQALFTARDGNNGSDGPPVLEFVWGQRVFGPCVIQNIQVRERAWDKGLLVNAEVSFDLEQVPEWTINDGFVDVLRPGRQSTVNDPLAASKTAGGETPPADEDQPPPSRTSPDPSPQTGLDPTLCNFAVQQSKIFQGLFKRADSLLQITLFDPSLLTQKSELDSVLRGFLEAKSDFYSGSQEVGKFVDSKLNNNGCVKDKYQDTIRKINEEKGTIDQRKVQALKFAHGCIRETKQYIDNWQQTSPKCKAQRVAGQKERISKEQEEKLNKQCEQIKPGSSCSGVPNLSERTISTCNSGKTVVCVRGTWELKYPRG
jgi:hypothetical protein